MKRLYLVLAIIALIPVSFLTYCAAAHHQARRAALTVIADLGGNVGSLPAPFGGTEYVVSFRGPTLTRADIARLAVLNDLAVGWNPVSLSLDGAQISPEDRRYLEELLFDVHVYPAKRDPPPAASH